jgi:hypothetical protein|tara:strand:+ start:167 stop:670 length:504 start_codon:yes stop_codon:yes gene_type:complete
MGQEFFINSQELESKIRQLLPSQGGAGAGFDLSASTQIIPIIDLTESAEGSNVRADIQTSLSHSKITSFNISNAQTTILNNTGYFRIFGVVTVAGSTNCQFNITDGSTSKFLKNYAGSSTNTGNFAFDFVVFLEAGDSVNILSTDANSTAIGCTRQIADITGNLVNP